MPFFGLPELYALMQRTKPPIKPSQTHHQGVIPPGDLLLGTLRAGGNHGAAPNIVEELSRDHILLQRLCCDPVWVSRIRKT